MTLTASRSALSEARSPQLKTVGDFQRLLEDESAASAWKRFDDEFRPRLLGYAYRITENLDLAQDLVQLTLMKWHGVVTIHPLTLRAELPIIFWLMRTCRNAWIDERRKGGRGREHEERLGPEVEPPEHELRLLILVDYQLCFAKLSLAEQQVLRFWSFEMSVREAAAEANLHPETGRRRFQSGTQRLLSCIQSRGWTAEDIGRAVQ